MKYSYRHVIYAPFSYEILRDDKAIGVVYNWFNAQAITAALNDLDAKNSILVGKLKRLIKWAALANELQHNKVQVPDSVWSELYQATNEARAGL